MNPRSYLELAGGVLLLVAVLVGLHWRGQRDDVVSAVSIAAHAVDAEKRPITLSPAGAIVQVRILGQFKDDALRVRAEAAAADAAHVNQVERKDAATITEVSKDVLAQLDRTQDDLAASRALAAQRLRALAARDLSSSGGAAAIAADPDAVCGAAFAASCDEVLALFAEAERNTAQLVGWQRFWREVKANHDGEPGSAEPAVAE